MKVFISSVIKGFEAEREAVRDAILTLDLQVIRAEDFGASSSSPRVTCLSGVRQSDLVVLVLGDRYGYPQASGISATHEEFKEAAGSKEMIAFIQNSKTREPDQEAFIKEVQEWQNGLHTVSFDDPSDLKRHVLKTLHKRGLDEARGRPDADEMVKRAMALLPSNERSWSHHGPTLKIALATGPHQNILRPSEVGAKDLEEFVYTTVMIGPNRLFDRSKGTESEVVDDAFVCSQDELKVVVHADAGLLVSLPLRSDGPMAAIIEEDVRSWIERTFALMDTILSKIDPTEKARYVAPVVDLSHADHCGWRTADEHRRSPNSMTVTGMYRNEKTPAHLRPAALARAALRTRRGEMAEDLTVLLKRQMNG